MKKPVLVIMAAGMGSRYGGLKQIDPIDSDGHIIIDFSIYDAVRAGFEKVIFIIKRENDRFSVRPSAKEQRDLWKLLMFFRNLRIFLMDLRCLRPHKTMGNRACCSQLHRYPGWPPLPLLTQTTIMVRKPSR